MLHSFDAATGAEEFAFIPGSVFRGVAGTVAGQDVTGIQALTYQDGGVPIYHHHFYVDSSPRVGDVDFGNGTGNWHTILVGGLGKGGNSYYALDITDASATDENAAAAKVLWEWRNPDNDDDLAHNHKIQTAPGYSYGRPVIVKTRAYGWTVIVTSGYNNKSGVGQLYFLNPQTGAVMKTMSTGVGTPANPSGFAQIHAFVKDESNQIAEQVTYSWYDQSTNTLKPAAGETTPIYPKSGAYSWLKAPRYSAQAYEAGPLARILTRHLCRRESAQLVIDQRQ
jgi:type IV pilus assembly protein PilY1